MDNLITFAIGVALDGREPPKEIRLFRRGVNSSLKGSFLFDEKAAAQTMEAYATMGHSLSSDYDHGSLHPNPVDPSLARRSSGLFDMELKDGELWAINYRPTPDAAEAIKKGEWPFISPAFRVDADGRVALVLNFALTANPAMFIPPQLIAAAMAAALQSSGGTPSSSENTTVKYQALNDYMKQLGCSKPAMATSLGLSVAELDVLMGGEADMSPQHQEAMKRCPPGSTAQFSAVGAGDVVSLSAVAVLAGRPGADRDAALARVGELQTAAVQLLSVTGQSMLSAAVQRAQSVISIFADLVKLSGAPDEARAAEELRGLCHKRASIEEAAVKVREQRVTTLLSAARAANKIVPAEIDGPKGLRAMGLADTEWLETHLSARQPITMLAASDVEEVRVETGGAVAGAVAVAEKDGVVMLNGLPYEKIGFDVKHNLRAGSPAEQKAFAALKTNWDARGRPSAAV